MLLVLGLGMVLQHLPVKSHSVFWFSSCDIPKAESAASTMPLAVRRRVAVYGGSFSPITVGHLAVVAELVHTQVVDEVRVR